MRARFWIAGIGYLLMCAGFGIVMGSLAERHGLAVSFVGYVTGQSVLTALWLITAKRLS